MASSGTFYTSRVLTAAPEFDATAIQVAGSTVWGLPTFTLTLTNGSTPPVQGSELTINYLLSNTDYTSVSQASKYMIQGSARHIVRSTGIASAVQNYIINTAYDIDQALDGDVNKMNSAGGFLYVWLSHDFLGQTVTCSLTATG